MSTLQLVFFHQYNSKTTGNENPAGLEMTKTLKNNPLIGPYLTNALIFEWLPALEFRIFLLPYDGRDPKLSGPESIKSVSLNRS